MGTVKAGQRDERRSSTMVVKSGGNWKRPVNRMYTYNFQIGENYYLPMTSYLETKTGAAASVPGPLCFSEWRELLSAHDQLPGDQDWRRRECPGAVVLLREDLPPPTEWHQCERVRRSVGGDNQEDETSHLQHVTPHQYLD